MKKRLLILLILLLPLTGSCRRVPLVRLLQEARVDFYEPPQTIRYRDQGKLSELLNCLRLARPGAPVQPEDGGQLCRIRLYYTDGSLQDRYLQNYRSISTDGTQWSKISPDSASYLYVLLHLLPGDN